MKYKALRDVPEHGLVKGDVVENPFPTDHDALLALRRGVVEKQADDAKLVRAARPASEIQKLKDENAALKAEVETLKAELAKKEKK